MVNFGPSRFDFTKRKREIKKEKDILTWKLSTQSDIHPNNQFNSINKIVLIGPIKRIGPMVTLLKEGWLIKGLAICCNRISQIVVGEGPIGKLVVADRWPVGRW